MRWLVLSLLVVGCRSEPPPSPQKAPAALQKLWRDSLRYQKAHRARARNKVGFEADRRKLDRMLTEVQAYAHCPVTKDAAADRAAVEALLGEYLTGFTPGSKARVKAGPAPAKAPPSEASTTQGYDYADDQVAGHHRVRVTLEPGDLAAFLKGLKALPRLLEVVGTSKEEGRAVVVGRVAYFRDLQPLRFVRPKPDVEALVREAAGGLPMEGAVKAKADKVRANYAAVDALEPELEASLAVSAQVKVREGRWRFYKGYIDRFNKRMR